MTNLLQGCQVVIDHPTVSALHLAIIHNEHESYVVDLGSAHGTVVGEERLIDFRCNHGTSLAQVTVGFKVSAQVLGCGNSSCVAQLLLINLLLGKPELPGACIRRTLVPRPRRSQRAIAANAGTGKEPGLSWPLKQPGDK